MSEFGENEELQSVDNRSLRWIDVQKPTSAKLVKLAQYPFHELNIEDSLSKSQIPKLDSYDDYVFVVLNFPIISKDDNSPHPVQLAIFAGNGYLVTIQHEELKPITEAFQLCKVDEKYRDTFMGNSSGYLLYKIIDMMVDDLLHILIKIEGNLDDIEDEVFDPKTAVPREISILRREITNLRRLMFPLKRTVMDLSKQIQRLSDEDLTLYFDDIKDHLDKVVEALDESKETIEIFKDTDFMLSTEKSNKILAILTILFTLSIPATVIGAFYGMNINLPGGTVTGPANFWGEYSTFVIISIAAIVPALAMIFWFRKEGWLRH